MTRQNERKMKLYMEAGLAVLLVLTIALASAAGLLSPQAGERDKNKKETAAVQEKSQDQKKNDSDSIESQETIADGQYPIMGDSRITVSEMVDYFQASGKPYPKEALSKGGAESIEEFCQMYYDEASAEGVRPEVAFVQTMKETGFLQYGGDASIEQFNFAGLGTTGGGVPGNSYPDVQTGIRAQIQHLKAYATAEPLNGECVDDRYEYVKKGAAPYVEWLGQKENPEGLGWATGENYGYDIVRMIRDMEK
ncbi:glucosaminidase domain-containing protein [Mediterraneibacter sp.]|jgi:hypothetical protein|uniref:glucosaminidase domain-containing protein n=1 Tax=Mediterraneibacter sp. TaxID=2316022 RepID=UPI0027BA040E|nr:glucosaminidase domain-containing protein [Mediterraneibacter sp.]